MRKGIAILLFTCLCCTLLGYHLVFNFQLASVKAEMKAYLKSQQHHKDVVQLSLTKVESNQLYWEDEDEFEYKGEMYDVIDRKLTEGVWHIRCVADTKETDLLNEYQKNNKHSSSGESTIVQLITMQFDLPTNTFLKQPQDIVRKYFTDYSSSLTDVASEVLLPPPDVC